SYSPHSAQQPDMPAGPAHTETGGSAAPDPQLVAKVVEILHQGNPDSQAVVLPLLAALPADSPFTKDPQILGALRSDLEASPRPTNYAQVLNAASSFPILMQEPGLRQQVLAGLNDPSPEVQRAAIRVSLEHFLNEPQTAAQVKEAY